MNFIADYSVTNPTRLQAERNSDGTLTVSFLADSPWSKTYYEHEKAGVITFIKSFINECNMTFLTYRVN